MRKTIGIVIGCVMLFGAAIAAQQAVPPPPPNATVTVTINGNTQTDGVDTPWFELSKSAGETVSWTNVTSNDCRVIYRGPSPFLNNVITVAHGATSRPMRAENAPDPPPGWSEGKVYKFYKYTVACENNGGVFDPGNGIKR